MTARRTDDLDWNLVKTFVTVAECGSLASAAELLGLAHPTVARHVQTLEAALGVALFDRRANGLKLNDAGRRMVSAAGDMRSSARAFELATHAVRTTGTVLVRFTASEFLADVFPELLAPLRQSGGEADTAVQLLIGNELLNLLEGEADIAIRHVQPQQQDLICRRLGGLPLGLYASRSYLEEWGEPTLATASEHRFIDSVSPSRVQREAKRRGIALRKEQFVFRSDHFAGRLSGALSGWGIAVVPLHVARKHTELVPVLHDMPDMVIDMWLVGRQEVRSTPYLKAAFSAAGDNLNRFVADLNAPLGSAPTKATANPPSRTSAEAAP